MLLVNFVSSLTDKFNKMEEDVSELQQSNHELKQSNLELKKFTFYPLLIRQLRKEAKERIIKSSGLKSNDYDDNCEYLSKLICKNNIKEFD